MNNLVLKSVCKKSASVRTLYELLKVRNFSISHEKLPSFEEHEKFVKSHPYRQWWLVQENSKLIGSVYLTNDNAIGINLIEEDQRIYYGILEKIIHENTPLPQIPSVRPKFFYVNVAPENLALKDALSKMGAKHTQCSYRI